MLPFWRIFQQRVKIVSAESEPKSYKNIRHESQETKLHRLQDETKAYLSWLGWLHPQQESVGSDARGLRMMFCIFLYPADWVFTHALKVKSPSETGRLRPSMGLCARKSVLIPSTSIA